MKVVINHNQPKTHWLIIAKTKFTNTNRESNSNYYNMNSGAKQNRDKEDDKTLVRNLKAVKKQS
jgi:hypothetical protein